MKQHRLFPLSRFLCLLLVLLLALPPAASYGAQAQSAGTTRTATKTKTAAGSTAKPSPKAKAASSARAKASPGKSKKNTAKKAAQKSSKSKTGRTAKVSKRAQPLTTPPAAAVHFKSAILYNVTAGRVIFSRQDRLPIPPASLTKILSMYVALDAMKNRKISPGTLVKVSPKAAATGGSRMGLHAGDRVRLEDLLRGMAVASGNDASVAVAEYIGGNEAKFVRMMNRKARQIGMTGSVFRNANGLPAKGQVTTARDMLTLARSYLRAYPGNLAKFHNHRSNEYKGAVVSNANPLLSYFRGADGLKTGFVNASGYNLIGTASRDGVRLIGVFLGAPTSSVRARKAMDIMEAGFGKLACPIPPKAKKRK